MILRWSRIRGPGVAGASTRLAIVLLATACGPIGFTPPTSSAPTTTGPAPTTTTGAPPPPTTTTIVGATTPTTRPPTTTATTQPPVPFDPTGASILAIKQAMEDGRLTSVELVEHHLARIEAYDEAGPALNAILALNPNALNDAAARDAERAAGTVRGPLHGIPVVLKDNIETAGLDTTAGSRALEGFVPPSDAAVVARLRQAGAIVLAKVNLHEWARDTTTISSLGGQTLNPWDPTRHPGGSSGGTGAAVAAEFALAGLGSDTCGSIRIPSALNGLYGVRPTRGLISTEGVIPLSPSEDTVGPMARFVADLAIVLDAIAGPDPVDPNPSGVDRPDYLVAAANGRLEGARIGVLDAFFADSDPEVVALTQAALDEMAAHGAEIVPMTIPGISTLFGTATTVFLQEWGPALDEYLAARDAPVSSMQEIIDNELHLPELEERLRRAAAVTTLDTAEYRAALEARDVARAAADQAFVELDLDAIAYPAVRFPATIAGSGQTQPGNNCRFASVADLPAMVIPVGPTAAGLPVGLELMGAPFSEATLVSLAGGWERVAPRWRLPTATPALPE